MSLAAKCFPEFITVTCLERKFVLRDDRFKHVITDSLRFLSSDSRVYIYAFVIMDNHFHMIWQMRGNHKRSDVQRDLLKFISQYFRFRMQEQQSSMLKRLVVNAPDRVIQVWEKNSLSVPLFTSKFFFQKLGYIHRNPVKAGMCERPEEYKYSSAKFYMTGEKDWDFLVHYDG